MKRLLASSVLTAAFALGLTACGPAVFPNRALYGSGSYSPQLAYGRAMNGYNPGLAMAGPAGAVAARMGGIAGGGFVMPPGGAGQSLYANTAYDPATHASIVAQSPPTYIVGGGGAAGGVVVPPNGTVTAATSGQVAASQQDVRDLRDGVRVLMQQQVTQRQRLDRLERR